MNARIGQANNQHEFEDLEVRLRGTLRPVVPPHDLVGRLQTRIRIPDASEIRARLRDWQTLWLVLAAAFSIALVIMTMARALFHLTGRREST